jgi:hypothetical protein
MTDFVEEYYRICEPVCNSVHSTLNKLSSFKMHWLASQWERVNVAPGLDSLRTPVLFELKNLWTDFD